MKVLDKIKKRLKDFERDNLIYSVLFMVFCVVLSGIHIILLLIFLYNQVYPLMVINIFSILIYLVCLWLLRKKRIAQAYYVICGEVFLFSFLMAYAVGQGYLFDMYCLATIPFTYLTYYILETGENDNRKKFHPLINCFIAILFYFMEQDIIWSNHVYAVFLEEVGVRSFLRVFNTSVNVVCSMVGCMVLSNIAMRGIRQIRRNMKQIEELAHTAEQSSKAKSIFLASVSHEIRTPINGVIGMNEMILRESKERNIREYAGNIKSAAQTLLDIINDILDLTKIESGKMEIYPVEYELGNLLTDLYHVVIGKAEEKGLKLSIQAAPDLPSLLMGDDVRIRQILMNLLTNAIKYTEKGEVILSVSGRVHGDIVVLDFEVKDTGVGIKPENISKLFETFERIDEVKHRSIEGIGLGLSITKQLLEKMGSRLEIQSEYGKGSAFSFSLEQMVIDAKEIGNFVDKIKDKGKVQSYKASLYAPDARILVVDDNEVNRKVFSLLLKETGVQVKTADSGEACLKMVQEEHFDLIFLDHMMVHMDGIETLQKMQTMEVNLCKDTPVIAFSANATTGAKDMFREAGFDGFLPKPIAPNKLERILYKKLPKELILEGTEQKTAAEEPVTEELPYIDGMDWEYAKRHFPNTEMLKSFVQNYYNKIDDEVGELTALSQNLEMTEGLKNYQTKVHSMKSTAAMMGAIPLSGVARILEYAAEAGEVEKIKTVTPVFTDELKKYKERLQILVPEEKEKKQIKSRFELLAELEMLKNALEELDIDSADAIIEQMNGYSYEDSLKEQMERLNQLVLNLKYEEAQQFAGNMIQVLN